MSWYFHVFFLNGQIIKFIKAKGSITKQTRQQKKKKEKKIEITTGEEWVH